MDKKILNEKQAASYIGMSLSYLRNDRCYGTTGGKTPGPVYVKLGRAVRYAQADLDAWLMAHRVQRVPLELMV